MTDIPDLIERLEKCTFKLDMRQGDLPAMLGRQRKPSPVMAATINELAEAVLLQRQVLIALRATQWVPIADDDGNSIYGYHPNWVDGDSCPDGVRELAYAGDHYISCQWNMCQDHWYHVDATGDDAEFHPQQPTHVMRRFPFPPSPPTLKDNEQ